MPANFESDPDEVISVAFGLKINQKRMKKMEKEYTTMKTKEKEDEIELKRLRTENRLLRQRADILEQESCNLADRLIQGQVSFLIKAPKFDTILNTLSSIILNIIQYFLNLRSHELR